MTDHNVLPVVAGIDGSATAVCAALWAVDEAISRDVPLQLIHVLEQRDSPPGRISDEIARGRDIVGRAVKAIEASGRPVKIERDIVRGRPAAVFIRLSRTASMLCVGATGRNTLQHGHIGSTAVALAGSAHCAVAVLHGATPAARVHADSVLVVTDDSPDFGALFETATTEAKMRDAPLQVLTCWQPPRADPVATREGDRLIRAQVGRRLFPWRSLYPDLRVEVVIQHGGLAEYLAAHARRLQMLIVSARGPGHVREVVGPAANAALASCDCVVLVIDHHHL